MRKLAPLSLLLLVASLSNAQSAQSLLNVNPADCVWHAGDNPVWASTKLDDSGWRLYADQKPASSDSRIWIRCRSDLSPLRNVAHPAIQIALYSAYEVYVVGEWVGSAGMLQSGRFSMDIIREWPISRDLASPAVIALRLTRRVVSTVPVEAAPPLAMHAGAADLLENHRSAVMLHQIAPRIFPAVCFMIIGVLGLILLLLWSNERNHRELLMLAISCAALPFIYLDYTGAAALLPFSVSLYFIGWVVPAAVANVTRVLFFFALARRRVPVFFWILIAVGNGLYLPGVFVPLLPPAQALWLDSLRSHQLEAIGDMFRLIENFAPFAAFLPWRRLALRMKPLAALSMAWGVVMGVFFAVRSTATHLPGIPDLQARWGFAVADAEAVSVLALIGALLFLLFREQQQTAHDRAVFAGELHAAGEIQRMLAPATLECASGLRIAVAFHPMREVGGDFYLCRMLPDNRQRILIGDVSGKGSAAAMTATLLLGAAADRQSDSPADLLDHLNRVLRESRVGGFATCLCADFNSDGAMLLANAGHIPPYCRGEETSVPSGLPLGLSSETGTYESFYFTLAPRETLTFLSDGVVEARAKDGELFGFDRTRQISTQSAEAIAQAAQQFGQEDDITVLTLTFDPAEVRHA